MIKETLLRRSLKIPDKHAFCRRLILDLYAAETEFMERKFYELCFTLYARFCMERLSPQVIYQYFAVMQEIFSDRAELYTEGIRRIVLLGLQLNDFTQYSENALQLSHIMLQINAAVTEWQHKNHICKYCGHTLDLLTQKISEKVPVLS